MWTLKTKQYNKEKTNSFELFKRSSPIKLAYNEKCRVKIGIKVYWAGSEKRLSRD